MAVSESQLLAIMPTAGARIQAMVGPLNTALDQWAIDTPLRQAHFLAQIAHESGELKWLRELWGPTLTQAHYEFRSDLGNTQPGDGFKFRGRGLIQITGRSNYANASQAIYADDRLLDTPELLQQPEGAAASAGWFWDSHGINAKADADDIYAVTHAVNGGLNGLPQRQAYLAAAKQTLGVS